MISSRPARAAACASRRARTVCCSCVRWRSRAFSTRFVRLGGFAPLLQLELLVNGERTPVLADAAGEVAVEIDAPGDSVVEVVIP